MLSAESILDVTRAASCGSSCPYVFKVDCLSSMCRAWIMYVLEASTIITKTRLENDLCYNKIEAKFPNLRAPVFINKDTRVCRKWKMKLLSLCKEY